MGLKEFLFEKLGINRKKKKPDTIEHTKAQIKYIRFFIHQFYVNNVLAL